MNLARASISCQARGRWQYNFLTAMPTRSHLVAFILALCLGALVRADDAPQSAPPEPIPGVPHLSPTETVPLLPGEPQGAFYSGSVIDDMIAVSPRGDVALVVQYHDTIDLWTLSVWHWRYWLGALAALSLLLGLWLMRRVLRRRREAGRPYCRRCNYDLTGNTSATCSECGSVVAGRGTIIGRPLRRRLLPALALILLLPAASAVSWFIELDITSAESWFYWPSDALHDWLQERHQGELPEWVARGATTRLHVHQYDLHTGKVGNLIADFGVNMSMVSAVVSPDGTRAFVTNSEAGVEWDFAEARIVQKIAAPPEPENEALCDFGVTLRAAYVAPRRVQTSFFKAMEWDLEKGEARWLFPTAEELAAGSEHGFTGEPPELAAGLKPYSVSTFERYARTVARVWDRSGKMVREFSVPGATPAGKEPRIPLSHHLCDDGLTVWFAFLSTDDSACWLEAWDVEKGTLTKSCMLSPLPTDDKTIFGCTVVIQGRYLFIEYIGFGGIGIYDTESVRRVGDLVIPPSVAVESITVSLALDSLVVIAKNYEIDPVQEQAMHYDLSPLKLRR